MNRSMCIHCANGRHEMPDAGRCTCACHGERKPFSRGDIVQTMNGAFGVVVGFPSPNTLPPRDPMVLILRDDDLFGGFEGAFIYHDHELKKRAEVKYGPDMLIEAKAWMKSRMVAA